MDLTQVRADLSAALQAQLPQWRHYPYVPDSPAPPALIVGFPDTITYGFNIAGWARIELPLMVLVGRVVDRSSQQLLNVALSTNGPGSVVGVLSALSPQGTAFRSIKVVSAGELRAVTAAGVELLAADITLEVLAS